MSPDDPRHGTLNAYKNLRCRCAACSLAESRYEKRRKWLVHQGLSPSLPALGFQRRVHALMRIGWTQKSIAEALGIAAGNLAVKMRANVLVYRATHVAMCEVYEAHCMSPQSGVVQDRTARIAAKRGWPPPLAWNDIDNDEAPVETAANLHHYLAAELVAEWDFLRRSGESIEQAARQLGVTVGAIEKALERVAKESAA